MNYVVIFAGGVGARMGSKTPKQFLEVQGKPIIIHTLERFHSHSLIDGIIVVCKVEYINYCKDLITAYKLNKVFDVIAGGETGQISIFNGIQFLYEKISKSPESDIILIHDGVRPVITEELITNSILCTQENGNSIAVSQAIETVIKINKTGGISEILDRTNCRNAKAPQCFYLERLWTVHQQALKDGITNSIDTATLMSSYGDNLHTIECSPNNIKITTPNDYFMFKGMYEAALSEKYSKE